MFTVDGLENITTQRKKSFLDPPILEIPTVNILDDILLDFFLYVVTIVSLSVIRV